MTRPNSSGADCVRAWEAMPAVLQGRALQEQDGWLRGHVAICNACRGAFDQQSLLRLTLSMPTDLRLDADVGLRRLLARIDAAEHQTLPAPLPARAGWLQRALLAAVIIQGLGLSVMGARLWLTAPAAAYRTLSDEPVPVPTGTIRVVPDSAMALTDWNALLRVLHLRVVGGPDAAGAYTVAPMSPTSATAHILAQLRATHGVRLAEAVPAR